MGFRVPTAADAFKFHSCGIFRSGWLHCGRSSDEVSQHGLKLRDREPQANKFSGFVPTCAECSTKFPAPGVNAVRGESAMALCRECHRKMGTNESGEGTRLLTDISVQDS